MKKILLMTPSFYPSIGGIEEQVKLLGKEFLRRGYEVDILTYKKGRKGSQEIIFGMNVFTHNGFWGFLRFFRTKKEYELIISRQYYKMSFFLGLLKFFGVLKNTKTCVVGDGGTIVNEIENIKQNINTFSSSFLFILSKNNFLIGNNDDFIKSLFNVFPQGKVKKIYNGLPYKYKKRKIKEIKNILFLSRFDEGKGHKETIDAFKKIDNESINLHIAGYGDKLIENEIKNSITLDERITFHGKLYGIEKTNLIENIDLFIFPTYYKGESFGMVICEMAQENIPIITTDFADTKKIYGDNILYVNKRDAVDLEDKMNWIIKNISHFSYDYSSALQKVDIRKTAQQFLDLQ